MALEGSGRMKYSDIDGKKINMQAAFIVMQMFSLLTFVGLSLVWAVLVMTNWERFPEWEGRALPVVIGFRVTSAVEAPDGTTDLSVVFNKVRPCEFIRNNVYYDFKGIGAKSIDVVYTELDAKGEPFSRVPGRHDSGPWNISVPFPMFNKENLVIESVHKCHPLFLTRTPAYNGH